MRIAIVLLGASIAVASCDTDPADVVLLEKSQVNDAVALGQTLREATSALSKLGYSCPVAETGNGGTTAQTLCTMTTEPGKVNCAVTMRVQLSHSDGRIDRVNIEGSDKCS